MKRFAVTAPLVFALVALLALTLGNWLTGASAENVAGVSAIKGLSGCTTNSLGAQDDDPSPQATLPFSLDFFGTTYNSLYVNNNGNVTFDGALSTYTPFGLLGTESVIIAPFFADVDTRGPSSGLTTYGPATFGGRPTFCVNWLNVGYYSQHTDKTNSFQLLLVDRSDVGQGDFDIIFNYNRVQWETGDVSGGTNGLGGNSARAGYSNGDNVSFELPGSAVNGALLDNSASGLVHNSRNSIIAGRFVFEVRNGVAPVGGTIEGTVYGDPAGGAVGVPAGIVGVPLANAPVALCPGGGPPCQVTSTNANGFYQFTGLPAGVYNAAAWPPAGWDLFPGVRTEMNLPADSTLTGQDIFLAHPGPLPQGVTIDAFASTPSGAPVIHWDRSIVFSVSNCPGGSSASWQLIKNGVVIASGSLSESPAGVYNGKIPPLSPQHGAAVLHVTIDCPSGPDKDLDIDVYIDPSGIVKTTGGAPIAGATVTLLRSDSASGPFDPVPGGSAVMAPSNRTNPDMTDANGVFHWDVIAGYYKVRAEKQGCHAPGNAGQPSVETGVLAIPPEAVGLEMVLECAGGAPTPTQPGPQPTATRTPTQPAGQPTATRTPTRTPTTPAGLLGDVNCNGSRDSIDATLVLQYGASLLHTLNCLGLADLNHDGLVNSIDATIILQYVAGLLH